MKYKASYDITVVVMTLLAVIVMVFLFFITAPPVRFVLAFVAGPVFLLSYLYAPQSYRVDNDFLMIVRIARNKKVKLSDISEIEEIYKEDMGRGIRTMGVGGLFGYFGLYNYSAIGNVTLYATQADNMILIKLTSGKKIIITPNDVGLVEKVKELQRK